MDGSKATSSSSLKRTRPRRRIVDGFDVVECKICNARFKSLLPLSQHVLAVHQMTLSSKNRRQGKKDLHARLREGLTSVVCSICKERFTGLMPLYEHINSQHKITSSLQKRRQLKEEVDDAAEDDVSGCTARHEDAVKVDVDEEDDDDEEDEEGEEEEEEEESEDDEEEEEDDDDDDDEDEEEDDEVEGNEIWFTRENLALNCKLNAEAALEYLNDQVGGKKYQLVEHGPTMATNPAIEHINFKAKEKDCPDAPNETFFAQMSSLRGMVVDCCVSLGPSYELPHWRNANLGGCKLCKGIVHHPVEMVDKLRLK